MDVPKVLILRGGRVIDATGERVADVLVDERGVIVAVGPDLTGDRTLDAGGCVVAPGFVDLHVHLRQPGREEAETIETGARGAALGGFTAIVAMPNTDPTMDCASVIRDVQALATRKDARVVVVAGGADKVGPLQKTLDAKLCNVVITDEESARRLLKTRKS